MRKSAVISVISVITAMALMAMAPPAVADDEGSGWVDCQPELRLSVVSPTLVHVFVKPGRSWWREEFADDSAEAQVPTPPTSTGPDTAVQDVGTESTPSVPDPGDPAQVPGPGDASPAQDGQVTPGAAVAEPQLRDDDVTPSKASRWRCPYASVKIKGKNMSARGHFEAETKDSWERDVVMSPNETLSVRVQQGPDWIERSITTPSGVPDPPANLIVKDAGPTSLTMDWTRPRNDSEIPITKYVVWVDDVEYRTVTSTSVIVAPLSADTEYTIRVYAWNAFGPSKAAVAVGRTAKKATAPYPPVGLHDTVVTQSTVGLAWGRPADGGSPILGYEVAKNGRYWDYFTTEFATATDLEPNTKYEFAVVAVNDVGKSAPSSIEVRTPKATVPGAPEGLEITGTNKTSIAVAWKPPAYDGGRPVTGYTVSWGRGTSMPTTKTSALISGLKPATRYIIKVVAVNAKGDSAAASRDASTIIDPVPTPTVPTPPQKLTAPGSTQTTVTLDWAPPKSDGGTEVTGYTITWGPGTKARAAATATSALITGLVPATPYDFAVTAENAMGSSGAATVAAWTLYPPVPEPTAPSPVREAGAIAASQTAIDVGWLPPASDGGSPVQFYLVSWGTGQGAAVSTTSLTAKDLLPGTEYTFTIQAKNQMGLSDPVTVKGWTLYPPVPEPTAPTAPRGLVTTGATATTVSLAWLRPESDGGNPISDYTVLWGTGRTITVASTSATVTGLDPSTDYTFAVRANNAMGASGPISLTVQTSARPTPQPGPTPKPADITPAAKGDNTDGSVNADGDEGTLRQTVDAKWPANIVLISGRALAVQKKTGLVTNANQEVTFAVTYMSPSIKSVVVQKRPNKGVYLLTATLKKGKKSGSVFLTANAPATVYKGRAYEALLSSQRFIVIPARAKR